jgi:hypothetical protein
MLSQSRAETALWERKVMNIESLAIETQEVPSSEQVDNSAPQQTPGITPLPPESYKLIGGGGSIILLG